MWLPMLCKTGDLSQIGQYTEKTWAASVKLDGVRLIVVRGSTSVGVYAGRNAASYTGQLPHIERALARILPPNSVIDGELVSKDHAVVGSGKAMAALSTNAVHEQDDMRLVIFDVLQVDGQNICSWSWSDRRHLVERLQVDGDRLCTDALVKPTKADFDAVTKAGFEGLVLKRQDSGYVQGRSLSWIKFKMERTVDCEIVNLPRDGKNSFEGLVGAIEFRMPNGQIGRASGMNMRLRQEMSRHPERYIGKMAEFKYQLETEDGRYRHPRFRRLRPDLEEM